MDKPKKVTVICPQKYREYWISFLKDKGMEYVSTGSTYGHVMYVDEEGVFEVTLTVVKFNVRDWFNNLEILEFKLSLPYEVLAYYSPSGYDL